MFSPEFKESIILCLCGLEPDSEEARTTREPTRWSIEAHSLTVTFRTEVI